MKNRGLFTYPFFIAVLGLAIVAVVYLTMHSDKSASLPTATSPSLSKRSALTSTRVSEPQAPDQVLGDLPASSSNETKHAPAIHLVSEEVLATVNKVSIQLQHLIPLGPEAKEAWLTSEEYDSRLKRAVDMEMIFQAARSEGVELTDAQKERVKGITDDHRAELEHYKKFGLSWSSVATEQDEFEQRLLTAQLLEQNLVSKKSTVSPSADPDVQSRYEQARLDLLGRLQAKATITGLTASR